MDFIKQIFELDFSSLVPEMGFLLDKAQDIVTVSVLIGPLVLTILGLLYMFKSPKEANYSFGYRTYFGMGSVEAWQFTQRVGGTIFTVLGFCLLLVMLVVVSDFSVKDPFEISMLAMKCMFWQAGLVIFARIVVAITAAVCFDSLGNRRREKDI